MDKEEIEKKLRRGRNLEYFLKILLIAGAAYSTFGHIEGKVSVAAPIMC